MRNTSVLLLAAAFAALSLACGGGFTASDGETDGATASGGSSTGSAGVASGSGGSSSGTTGAGGSMGGGVGGDSSTITSDSGAVLYDAKPDVPHVTSDAASDRGATGDGAGSGCLTKQDCKSGLDCLFPINGGCSVMGACMQGFDPNKPICNAISNSCSCSGNTVNVICNGLPNGYFSEPISHSGACDHCFGLGQVLQIISKT